MKNLVYTMFSVAVILLTTVACGPSKVLNNYSTTTEGIFNLKAGMTIAEINATLKSEPKDVYSNTKEKTKILVYKYRKGYQEVPMKARNNEQYLRGGNPVFKDEANLYIIIDSKTNKMLYFITDSGRKSARKEINESLKIKLLKTEK